MAHADLDALLNAVLPFAQQMLAEHGEFYPIGSSMDMDGEISLAAVKSPSEQPASQEVIDALLERFRARASEGSIRACVVCYDGLVRPPGQAEKVDAICAWLEHESGEAVSVFLPYQKAGVGRVTYGEIFASALAAQVFNRTVH